MAHATATAASDSTAVRPGKVCVRATLHPCAEPRCTWLPELHLLPTIQSCRFPTLITKVPLTLSA